MRGSILGRPATARIGKSTYFGREDGGARFATRRTTRIGGLRVGMQPSTAQRAPGLRTDPDFVDDAWLLRDEVGGEREGPVVEAVCW